MAENPNLIVDELSGDRLRVERWKSAMGPYSTARRKSFCVLIFSCLDELANEKQGYSSPLRDFSRLSNFYLGAGEFTAGGCGGMGSRVFTTIWLAGWLAKNTARPPRT